MIEVIYALWFYCFSSTLPMYRGCYKELIYFAKQMLDYVKKKLHVQEMKELENIYRRLFAAFGSCKEIDAVQDLYKDMTTSTKLETDKITYGIYYQAQFPAKETEAQIAIHSANKLTLIPKLNTLKRKSKFFNKLRMKLQAKLDRVLAPEVVPTVTHLTMTLMIFSAKMWTISNHLHLIEFFITLSVLN
eukprot:CAMPEP_0176401920 /NCGR_PEP_ID=MMETSP0126-20121128/48825_1 /TAXON_ID=141414 ORGANISM="Strombidinopsis acuminatum, Strain SPMC142" /NCGR_SAMPLE_ID=MMETSP0126 /ASSEMBLY_ACC=CAM_ASM_000229 /LENGTH=188 /DNA_ID=CAMNT_0017779149 /DNA_START=447 /DNA_END=1017 /DNA_ORIENTATION=+